MVKVIRTIPSEDGTVAVFTADDPLKPHVLRADQMIDVDR